MRVAPPPPLPRVDSLDPAAVVPVPDAGAHPERAIDERLPARDAELGARLTVLGVGDLAAHISVRPGDARLREDVAHRSALCARAEQGALRSAQHLDALQVEGLRQRVIGVEADSAHLDWRGVDGDACGTRGAAGTDT